MKGRIALITDTHFGHQNVVEYDKRKEDHEERVLRGVLKYDPDVLIHLGDVSFGRHEYHHLRLMDAINPLCRKWLIRGNHDVNSMTWYLNHGWHFVADEIRFMRLGFNVVLTHKPVAIVNGEVNIHGHKHKSSHVITNSKHIVSSSTTHIGLHMPDNDYQPYSLDALLVQCRKKKK